MSRTTPAEASVGSRGTLPTDPASDRRRLTAAALVLGPVVVLVSALLAHAPASQDAADVLSAVSEHRAAQLVQVMMEMFGLALMFAGCIGAAGRLRGRGHGLATAAIVLCFLGLAGFVMVDTVGLVLNALAGGADHSGSVQATAAINSSSAVYVAFPLILLGELGVVLIVGAYRRARLVPVWPVVMAGLSMVVDFSGGSQVQLLVSDLLALGALAWVAREVW